MKTSFVFLFAFLFFIVGWYFFRSNSENQPTRNTLPPNIILIYADDVDCESLFTTWPKQDPNDIRFPEIKRLAQNGMVFSNFHVTTPICGPSRASLLSGQYAHRNQVRVNDPAIRSANGFSGGYRAFNSDSELGTWMRQAGYHTTWVGKYLHEGFSPREEKKETWKSIAPKGWDDFFSLTGGNYQPFGRVGTGISGFTKIQDQYRTDYEADLISELLQDELAISAKPFFLCWAPFAAHLPFDESNMAHPRHSELFANEEPSGLVNKGLFRSSADQPEEVQNLATSTTEQHPEWSASHRNRLRTIQALDEGLTKIMQTLESSGKSKNTIVIFTSDHGFCSGQFNHYGKRLPIDRVTKVPFIAYGSGVPRGQQCDQLLANIDIAPTLLALAGGPEPPGIDGVSFADLLQGDNTSIGRDAIIIENWDRAWCLDRFVDFTYTSLRDKNYIYTEWASGSHALYDVQTDPEQVDNLYPNLSPEEQQTWAKKLRELRADNASEPPLISNLFIYPPEYKNSKTLAGNFFPIEFSGVVESDCGIQSLELEIFSERIQKYWDGKSWTSKPTTLPARLGLPGGNISKWQAELDTSGIAFDKNERMNRRDAVVNVIAVDQRGEVTRWNNALEFKLKITDPETWFDKIPEFNKQGGSLLLTGRAADNFDLASVKIMVFNPTNNRFWDPEKKGWSEKRVLGTAELKKYSHPDQPGDWASWQFEYDGPLDMKLFIQPRAYDAEGHFDGSPPYELLNREPSLERD